MSALKWAPLSHQSGLPPPPAPPRDLAAGVKAKNPEGCSLSPYPHSFSFLPGRENQLSGTVLLGLPPKSSLPPKSPAQILKASNASPNFGESAQLLLSHRPYRVNPFPSVAEKVAVRSIAAPAWKRAPPAVHRSPAALVFRELDFWLGAGSSCGSSRSPASRGTRAHALTLQFTLPRSRSQHPTLLTASPPGGGWGDVRTAVPRRAGWRGLRAPRLESWRRPGAAAARALLPLLCTRCHAAGPRGSHASLQVN